MTSLYQKYKDAEESLQKRVDSIGFSVKIEPIAALDMFYSDGLAGSCYGKAVFTKKENSYSQYQIFFPFSLLYQRVPDNLENHFKEWCNEVSKE